MVTSIIQTWLTKRATTGFCGLAGGTAGGGVGVSFTKRRTDRADSFQPARASMAAIMSCPPQPRRAMV